MTPFQKPSTEMTDAEIVAAVRGGSYALVPVSSGRHVTIGIIDLDDLKSMEGMTGLLIELSRDEAKFVAPQVIV